MQSDRERLAALITGMRTAYRSGSNAMAYAREHQHPDEFSGNETLATLIAYDLQAGSYVARARQMPDFNREWCAQIVAALKPLCAADMTVLEVGCGEATTLAGVLGGLQGVRPVGYGFDVSWSRIKVANDWLTEKGRPAQLFVADLFCIPLASNSIDIVYTSHSLEPNGGREKESIRELLRVASRYVVLVEPAYEMADEASRARMDHHGYVKGLRAAAEACEATVLEHRLLALTPNALNPSGLMVLEKTHSTRSPAAWRCPITATPLIDCGDAFVSLESGLAYPTLRGIPLLRPEHAVVASLLTR